MERSRASAPIATGSWCFRSSTRAARRARDARHIDLEYERIPQHFRDVYGELFRADRRAAGDRRAAAAWAAANLDDDVVGVQVRTWRDDPRRHRKYHLPALRRLDALLDGGRAERAVSRRQRQRRHRADARRALRRAARALVTRVRRRAPIAGSRRDGITEDLIDMLVLARTPRLFASYLSTFSEVAWWLGGHERRRVF